MFVHDYLCVYFEYGLPGPVLTFDVWPIVSVDGVDRRWGEAGYRDALCGLIGRTVSATEESNARGLVLEFGTSRLQVRPSRGDLVGPEIAMLDLQTHEDGGWHVWRPGEELFEELADDHE